MTDDPPSPPPPRSHPAFESLPPLEAPVDVHGEVSVDASPSAPAAEPPFDPLAFAGDPNVSLRDAIGTTPISAEAHALPIPLSASVRVQMPDPDDDEAMPRRPRRRAALAAFALTGVIGVGTLAFLGHVNAGRYAIVCTQDEITAEQGRSFPPWGERAMSGNEWKPVAIPPNAECKPRDTDDIDELGGWYLDALVDRANVELATHDATRVEIAAAELDQALLLARAPERRDQRNDIARLQGDVEYWRASAKLVSAQSALLDAAKQFDAAAGKRPRHVADASAWSAFVRKLADQLKGGPNGPDVPVTVPERSAAGAVAGDRSIAPPGIAMPVEPPPEPATAPVVDAGPPGGGVLL